MEGSRVDFRSAWISEGGYEKIGGQVFPHLKPDTFFLEYNEPGSGIFEPLAHVPKGSRPGDHQAR